MTGQSDDLPFQHLQTIRKGTLLCYLENYNNQVKKPNLTNIFSPPSSRPRQHHNQSPLQVLPNQRLSPTTPRCNLQRKVEKQQLIWRAKLTTLGLTALHQIQQPHQFEYNYIEETMPPLLPNYTILIALLLLHYSHAASVSISPTTFTINTPTIYTIQLNLGSSGIAPGTATITFPASAYSFTNSSAITNCYDTITPTTLYSCYASSSNAISLSWTSGMGTYIAFSINTLKNPPYVNDYTYYFSFAPTSGATFQTESTTLKIFQPDALTSCSLAFSPTYATSLSAFTVTLTNKNSIPVGGSLQLQFTGYTPTYSSLAISSPSPYITAVTPISSSNVLLLSSVFSPTVPASTSITLTISNVAAPPTTGTGLYSVTLLTSATSNFLNKIDQGSCSITGITDYPTANLGFSTSATLKVGTTKTPLFAEFTAPTDVDFTTDTISVTVASGYTDQIKIEYLSVPVNTNVTAGALIGTNITNGVSFPTSSTPLSIASGTATQISSGLYLTATLYSGPKNIKVVLYRNSQSYSSNTASLTVSPNVLQSASLSLLSSTVSAVTTYTFNLNITNPLGVGCGVKVTLPSSISIASGTCTASVASSVVNAVSSVILCSATGQDILVSNITSASLPTSSTLAISVSNIKNPTTTQTSSSLFYRTYYSLSQLTYPVDDSSGSTIQVTADPVTTPAANFLFTGRTSATNLAYASYSFLYTVYTTFPANGYLKLSIPAAMVLSASASVYCRVSTLGTNSSVPVTATTTSTNTLLKIDFNGVVTSTQNSSTTFTLTISNILNYFSYQPIGISLTTYTSDNYGVEQTPAVTITNTAPNTALLASTSNSNQVNGDTISYSFTLTSPAALTSTDTLSIELQDTANPNTQLLYSSTVDCTINSVTAACSKGTTNTKLLTVTTGQSLTANTAFTLVVNSVKLNRCLAQPGLVYISSYQSGTYLISTMTLTPPANSRDNLIPTATLAIQDSGVASPRLNVATSFTLSLTTTNSLTNTDYLIVNVPTAWTNIQSSLVTVTDPTTVSSMTGSLCSTSSVFCSNYQGDSHQLRVDDKTGTAFTSTSLSFTVASTVYVSPKDWASSYSLFSFQSFTRTAYSIDASNSSTANSAQFSLACPNSTAFHCRTCNSSGWCLTCYQTGEGYDTAWNYGGYSVRQSTGECVSSCGANYFNNSNYCEQCTAPCYGCLSAATTSCTSCIAPSVLNNSQCLAQCPDGYYNSSGVCVTCSSPCLKCSSSTACLSCQNSYYLSGTTCGTTCTTTGTYADNSTWTCAACIANCSSCSLTSSNCTACASTYFLTGTNICTQNCPSGTAKLNSTTCTCDYTLCLTCALTTTTCTSCDPGLVLKASTCTTSCGNNYYLSGSTCIACVANCQTCSASGCSTCNTTAPLLYSSNCYSSCPTGTSQSGTSCITCSTGCSACSSTSVCTSCLSIYYIIVYANLTSACTYPCPTSYPYLDGTQCVTTCSSGKTPDSTNTCVTSNTNTNNTNTNTNDATTTTLTSSQSKIIPFPCTIALMVLAAAALASKVALPLTILAACLVAFAGLVEVLSWLVFIVVAAAETDSTAALTRTGLLVVVAAYLITVVLNIIGAVFFKKYIWTDQKFQSHKSRLASKTKCGTCSTYFTLGVAVLLSSKVADLLFSNLFETQYFLYKVTQVNKLTPLNYVRYFTLLPTVLAIVGAAMANYEVQTLQLSSLAFIQSVDLIVVTLLAAIIGIWSTVRQGEQYETSPADKHTDIEEELEHEGMEDEINQNETVGGIGKYSKYKFSESAKHNDQDDRLGKKGKNEKKPLGEENNITSDPLQDELAANATAGGNRVVNIGGLDIEDIGLSEDSGLQLRPNKPKRVKDIKEEEAKSHRQKLKDSIENKLNPQERQQTKVIREVDTISVEVLSQEGSSQPDSVDNIKDLTKNQLKKEKLQKLSKAEDEDLKRLSSEEQLKAGEIKNAMSLLTAKKISIEDYLDYLDIIEEEEEDRNSDYYDELEKKKKLKGSSTKKKTTKGNNRTNERYSKVDPHLYVNDIDSELAPGTFDEDMEPTPAEFHNRPRNQSEDYSPTHPFDLSARRDNPINRSDNLFKKHKDLNDIVVVSLDSGDNDQPALGDQFQKGTTLKQTEKDELPPSNLYSTQQIVNKSKVNSFPQQPLTNKEKLMGQDDHIQYLQSEGADSETVRNQLFDFNNDISPSHFDEPNLRIENEEVSDAPTRPKINKPLDENKRDNNEVLEIEDLQQVEDYDQFEMRDERRKGLNRYESDRNLDYDDILYQKRKNEKMKQLEQIYLPRQEVPRAYRPKKRLNQSTNTHRQQK